MFRVVGEGGATHNLLRGGAAYWYCDSVFREHVSYVALESLALV